MAKNGSGRKPGSRPLKSIEIVSPIHLRREDLGKLSSSSFRLGQRFYWLGAYCTDLPPTGRVQHTGLMQGGEHTPPWRICGASNWAELYSQLVGLDRQRRLTSLIILYPALGEMPRFLKDNFSEFEDHCQAGARADGVEDFPRDPERIHGILMSGHRAQKGRVKGGSTPKERKGILLALKQLATDKPDLTCKQLWNLFPDSYDSPMPVTTDEGERFEIYKDGNCLVQVRQGANGKKSATDIKFSSFRRYFTKIKKNSRK